jgi:hypothetical protein
MRSSGVQSISSNDARQWIVVARSAVTERVSGKHLFLGSRC